MLANLTFGRGGGVAFVAMSLNVSLDDGMDSMDCIIFTFEVFQQCIVASKKSIVLKYGL